MLLRASVASDVAAERDEDGSDGGVHYSLDVLAL